MREVYSSEEDATGLPVLEALFFSTTWCLLLAAFVFWTKLPPWTDVCCQETNARTASIPWQAWAGEGLCSLSTSSSRPFIRNQVSVIHTAPAIRLCEPSIPCFPGTIILSVKGSRQKCLPRAYYKSHCCHS